jgi:hypothetical protein
LPSTEHASEDAHHAADRTTKDAAHRSGRLVAGLGSLLDTLNQTLRVCARGGAKKRQESCPNRATQSQLRGHGWC